MKHPFDRLESRLRAFFENRYPWMKNPSSEHPLSKGLVEALYAAIQTNGTAPHTYQITLNPQDAAQFSRSDVQNELAEMLIDAAVLIGYPPIKPLLYVDSNIQLAPGEFNISTDPIPTLGETAALDGSNNLPMNDANLPSNPCLILPDENIFSMTSSTINIGRLEENDLVIPDKRVSRSHAQIRIVQNHYVIFDMKSTGGTFVNGQRVDEQVLHSGDVINLAGVSLIYSEDTLDTRDSPTDTTNIKK